MTKLLSKGAIYINRYVIMNGTFYQAFDTELYHHGVKGQKWGVRRTPEQLGRRRYIPVGRPVTKTVVSGHSPTPKKAKPNSISEHIDYNGRIDVRTFYDENGMKAKDIHLSNHGNSKHHAPIHVVMYSWNADGSLKYKSSRKPTDLERRENADIL